MQIACCSSPKTGARELGNGEILDVIVWYEQTVSLSLFAVLLALFSRVLLAETPSTPKAEPETGLEGVILVGPIQGGPTRQGVPDSRPLPNTEFVVAKGQ